MSSINFSDLLNGMTMYDICCAYPRQVADAIEKHNAELAQLSHNTAMVKCPEYDNKQVRCFFGWVCGKKPCTVNRNS
jgi:hypothetical protein